MKSIAFIDTEVDVKSKKILDIGGVTGNGFQFHSNSISELLNLINQNDYICGHNIIHHDLPCINPTWLFWLITPWFVGDVFFSGTLHIF